MGFPSYVTCCFSLGAFNILFFVCFVFVSLISMCLGMFLLGFILYGTLCLLELIDYLFFLVGEIFNYDLLKIFSYPFSSLVFLNYIRPFNICCKAGLVILNYFNFCFSEKLLISLSILNEILARYRNLGGRFSLSEL